MLQLPPHSRRFLAIEPVDFRTGMDGRAAVCRQVLAEPPRRGALDVFRNRAGTALTRRFYDGQGLWRCAKRLSQGRFTSWPSAPGASTYLAARALVLPMFKGYVRV
jgi:transposase